MAQEFDLHEDKENIPAQKALLAIITQLKFT